MTNEKDNSAPDANDYVDVIIVGHVKIIEIDEDDKETVILDKRG